MLQVDVYVDGDITQAQVDRLNEMLKDYMSNEARSDWLQPADPLIYLNGTNVGRADIAYSATAVSSRVCVSLCVTADGREIMAVCVGRNMDSVATTSYGV